MKTIYKHIAFAALALSAVACTQEDDFMTSYQSDPNAVRITAQVGSDDVTGGFTRSNPLGDATAQTTFNANDAISVAAGSQAAVIYTLADDAKTWNPETDKYLKWEADEMNVTAYYPVTEGTSATAFTVPNDQRTEANVTNADYMTFSGTATKGDDKRINLAMERKMVRLVVDYTFSDQYKTGYSVSGITVHANTKGYANGEVQTGDIEISAYESDGKFYALLAPTKEAPNAEFLTLTVTSSTDNTDTHTLKVKGIPATEAGKSYNLSLTVGKNAVSVKSVSVKEWTGSTITGGEAIELDRFDETTNTYYVATAKGLYAWLEAVQNDLTLNLTLMADITLPNTDADGNEITVENGVPSGSNWTPMGGLSGQYTGIVEGNSHTITGLRISSTTDCTGFIGVLNNKTGTGEVRNLTLADAVVYSTANYVGGIAGYNFGGTISNCTFGSSTTDGSSVSSTHIYGRVGGIVGSTSGTVTSCTNNGTVSSSGTTVWAGGITAYIDSNILAYCDNNGSVSASGSSEATAGGIVGQSTVSSTVSDCTNHGSATVTDTPEAYVGGIVGTNENSTVSGCTNNGSASATDCTQSYAGGIVGNNDSDGTVEEDNINNGTPTTNVGNG